MKLIFLVTVLLCLLVTAKVGAVALGAACTPADGTKANCDDANAICPSTGTATCQCKSGYKEDSTACVAIADGKVNAACDGTKRCSGAKVDCTDGFCTCQDGFSGNKGDNDCTAIAEGKVNAACEAGKPCTGANVECKDKFCRCKDGFSGNKGNDDCIITRGTAGGACLSSNPACTSDTLVCQSSVCKIKAGAACTAPTAHCVPQSTCSTTCKCDDGYTALQTGLCTAIDEGKVNAACDETKVCTGTHVECKDNFCTCKDGFTGDKGDDDCTSNKGVALGQVSVWTLCMTILTVLLAVNVV